MYFQNCEHVFALVWSTHLFMMLAYLLHSKLSSVSVLFSAIAKHTFFSYVTPGKYKATAPHWEHGGVLSGVPPRYGHLTLPLHSQCVTNIKVGQVFTSWSNVSRLRFDQHLVK